jgi:hypothetical protein
MSLLIACIPVILATIVLWVLAHRLTRGDRGVELSAVPTTVALTLVCSYSTRLILGPIVGAVVFFILAPLIVRQVLGLSIWRSALLITVYAAVWTVAWGTLGLTQKTPRQTAPSAPAPQKPIQ